MRGGVTRGASSGSRATGSPWHSSARETEEGTCEGRTAGLFTTSAGASSSSSRSLARRLPRRLRRGALFSKKSGSLCHVNVLSPRVGRASSSSEKGYRKWLVSKKKLHTRRIGAVELMRFDQLKGSKDPQPTTLRHKRDRPVEVQAQSRAGVLQRRSQHHNKVLHAVLALPIQRDGGLAGIRRVLVVPQGIAL